MSVLRFLKQVKLPSKSLLLLLGADVHHRHASSHTTMAAGHRARWVGCLARTGGVAAVPPSMGQRGGRISWIGGGRGSCVGFRHLEGFCGDFGGLSTQLWLSSVLRSSGLG